VNFYETDAAGIVHFSTFFRYMEEAEHALWRDAGLSISPPGSEIGWPRVSVSFDYFRPLRFEDEFEILIRIEEITEKRIRYSCTITRKSEKAAEGSMTIACVRKRPNEPMKSAPIPSDIVTRLSGRSEGSPSA
jgi:YbgC/YbaW family acyl-CoA thioester hydrolase